MDDPFRCKFEKVKNEEHLLKMLEKSWIERTLITKFSMKAAETTVKNAGAAATVATRWAIVVKLKHREEITVENDSNFCQFKLTVEEVELKNGENVYASDFHVILKNRFADHEIFNEIWNGDILGLQGFEQEIGVQSDNRVINFSRPLNNKDQQQLIPRYVLDSKTAGSKLWLVSKHAEIFNISIAEIWNSTYTKLRDIQPCRFAFCYGIVTYFERFKTKQDEFVILFALVDESVGLGKPTNFMIKYDEKFYPDGVPIRQKHEIVRLQRVSFARTTQRFTRTNGYGRIGKLGLHALVWENRSASTEKPRSTTPDRFYLFDEDYLIVSRLRNWFQKLNIPAAPEVFKKSSVNPKDKTGSGCETLTFNNFGHLTYANLCCRIIAVGLTKKRHVILRVWDGTRPLNNSEKIDFDNDLLILYSYDKTLDHLIKEFSVDIFVYDEKLREKCKNFAAGNCVKLTNVHSFSRRNSKKIIFAMHDGNQCDEKFRKDIVVLDIDSLECKFLKARLKNTWSNEFDVFGRANDEILGKNEKNFRPIERIT